MATVTKGRIIKIGNSQGIRIPKPLIEQAELGEEVELEVQQRQLIIRSAHHPRQGWEERFRLMAEWGDDQLLDEGALQPTDWEVNEWRWQ